MHDRIIYADANIFKLLNVEVKHNDGNCNEEGIIKKFFLVQI